MLQLKNDPFAGAIVFQFLSFQFSIAPSQWLALVSLAVLYNIIFVVGRAVFWEINRNVPALWWTLDYLCDAIYIIDILVHCHEGKCFASVDLSFLRNSKLVVESNPRMTEGLELEPASIS